MSDAGLPYRLEDWVVVARLGKVRGLKGEMYALAAQEPEWLQALPEVRLRRSGAWLLEGQPLRFSQVFAYKDGLVLKFEGIESIDEAEALEQAEVVAARADRPPLEDGDYYLSDLIGCTAIDEATGRVIGTVRGWQEFGGPVILEIEPEGGSGPGEEPISIPWVREICVSLDLAAKRLVLRPPEGLIELNRREGAE